MRGIGRKIWLRNESAYPQKIDLLGPNAVPFGENRSSVWKTPDHYGKSPPIMEKAWLGHCGWACNRLSPEPGLIIWIV